MEFFLKEEIRYIFQIPGLYTLSLIEELLREANITIITARHESNMVHMADGHARVSGKPGIVITTAGPGLGLAVAGCMEAYGADVPLILVHISIKPTDIGKGVLHEIADPEVIFSNITKAVFNAEKPADIEICLTGAYKAAMTDRKGPVLVSIPYSFLDVAIPDNQYALNSDDANNDIFPSDRDKDESGLFLKNLAVLLDKSRKPVIIGGKSLVFEGSDPILRYICEKASIPFLSTATGKGAMREDHPWCFGNIMKHGVTEDILLSADCIIALGTRLRKMDTRGRLFRSKIIVHIDIDNHWINKNYPSRLSHTGNIRFILDKLVSILTKRVFDWDLPQLTHTYEIEHNTLLGTSSGYQAIRLLRTLLPDDITFACDLNLLSYWAEYYFPVHPQGSFLVPHGSSPIFYSLPAAIGAKLAAPAHPCMALCGDGGALPTLAELATIRNYHIPVVILILNNSSFGILELSMKERYGRQNTMDLFNPDFTGIARAFGIRSKTTDNLDGLEKIFREDISWQEPFIIEFLQPLLTPPWKVRF